MINSNSGEILAKWYLRFNGFFVVENFVVHAGDDVSRISKRIIGNHTEADILAIRHKFSREISGSLLIQNDVRIQNLKEGLIDYVIVEVKTGASDKPNKIWTQKKLSVIEYIIRFAGFVEDEDEISKIAIELSEKGEFHEQNKKYSIRLVLISEVEANQNWKHLTNITFDEIIEFLVEIRGQCWIEQDIGIASIHYQWDDLINQIFTIANDQSIAIEIRKENIKKIIENK